MAANLQSRSRQLASFGKQFVCQIYSPHSFIIPSLFFRKIRGVHVSVYDKNLEENVQERVHSTVVPDDVIPPKPNEYWAPHPQTGVFGPSADQDIGSVKDSSFRASTRGDSVLEEKAFFRSLEGLEKPAVQP